MFDRNPIPNISFIIIVSIVVVIAAFAILPRPASAETLQNIWERQMEWIAETNANDADMAAGMARESAAVIAGRSLVLTLNHFQWLDENTTDVGKCQKQFQRAMTAIVGSYIGFYATAYHFLTATTGEPADFPWWWDYTDAVRDTVSISKACIAKLDT